MTGSGRSAEPRWLRVVAFGSASAVATCGAVGLAFAVGGIYRPFVVFPLGAVLWIAVLRVARPILVAPGGNRRSDHLAGAGALVFIVAVACWNALHASHHVVINRDGGVYANAGRWIAEHGTLRVVANAGAFAHERGLTFGSIGIYEDQQHVLSFQFAHLLPTVLAEFRSIGGDRLMFATPALLAGLALLALFVAAWRLLGNPFAALGSIVAFAFVTPEVSFSRDTVSEIPSQLLLFTALWLLADRRSLRSPRTTFVAGLFLGLLAAARIDALLLLVALPILFAVTWLLASAAERRSVARSAASCAAGIAPGLALGFTDLSLRSTEYLNGLRDNVYGLSAVMAASLVVAFAVVALAPRLASWARRVPRSTPWVAATAVAGLGFTAWLVRPHAEQVRIRSNPVVSLHQAAAGIPVDPTRAYWERSMVWMSWYLGPITVAAAIIAAAVLARAVLRHRSLDALIGIALLGPASALYLWRASAFPDQVWVDRRYLDSALPLLVVLAFGLVVAIARWKPARLPRAVPVIVAVTIGAFAMLHPIRAVAPVRNMTEQRGNLHAVEDACRTLGPSAAVVVLPSPGHRVDSSAPQTLRSWCDADVAVAASATPARTQLDRLARGWEREGTTLWVVAGDAATIRAAIPEAVVTSTRTVTNPYLLRSTLLRRPSEYTTEQFSLAMARVPTQ